MNYFENTHKELSSKNKTFEEIVTILSDKIFLNSCQIFIKKINLTTIKPKIFSTIYMILSYPESVLGTLDIDENKKLFEKSSEIYNLINKFLEDTSDLLLEEKLSNMIKDFQLSFNNWIKKDSSLMIKEFTQIFWDLEHKILEVNNSLDESLDKDEKKIFIENIREKQQDIVEKIKKFGGDEGIKYLKLSNPAIIGDKIYKQIEENFKKAYWDKFQQDIEEKGFKVILHVLEEIKEYLLNLTPSKKDIEEINERIDIDLFKQMIENEVFSKESIASICIFLIDKVKYIGSKNDDFEMDKWKIEVENQFNNLEIKDYSGFLSNFFSKILNKIFLIMDEVKQIVNDPNYQKIKKNL